MSSSSSSPSVPANSLRTPRYQMVQRHNARALCSPAGDETIELDSMPLSTSSSTTTPLEWLADIFSGQPLVCNFEMVNRLISELVDNVPLISLDDIIEQWLAELEMPFISCSARRHRSCCKNNTNNNSNSNNNA